MARGVRRTVLVACLACSLGGAEQVGREASRALATAPGRRLGAAGSASASGDAGAAASGKREAWAGSWRRRPRKHWLRVLGVSRGGQVQVPGEGGGAVGQRPAQAEDLAAAADRGVPAALFAQAVDAKEAADAEQRKGEKGD